MEDKKKLSREEKISQFDELRKKYCAMMKSLKFYEDQCSKLTKNNTENDSKPAFVKTEKHCDGVERETPQLSQKKTKVQTKWKADPDLPLGWKYAEHFSSKSQHSWNHFKSPVGKIYQGISQVLQEFIESGQGREPLMKCLKREGWFETELLPPAHLMRQKRSEKGFYYLTSKAEKFETTVRMVKYLKEEYKWDKKLVDRFLNEHKSLYSEEALSRKPITKIELEEALVRKDAKKHDDKVIRSNPTELKWQPDIFLPDGWKVAISKHKKGSEVKRYMSPEGELLGNLCKALKHVMLNSNLSDEQMEILKDGLEYDGWSKETKLPEGWRVKRENNSESYLSPDLDLFCTRNERISKNVAKKLTLKSSLKASLGKVREYFKTNGDLLLIIGKVILRFLKVGCLAGLEKKGQSTSYISHGLTGFFIAEH